jgi:hypothetical protein
MQLPLWNSLAPRKRKIIFRLALALGIYAFIGFLVLPPIVRRVAQKQISAQLDREATIESVKINPFALSTTIRGLLIKDKDGEPFVKWDEVFVNFQLISLVSKAWTFKEISTTKPFVRVQVNKDGSFNFSDLIAKFSTNAPAQKNPAPAKPLVLHVDRLHIGGAVAALADLTPREPFRRALGPLDITLENFDTHPDNKNPYAFTGTTDAGEKISWSGYFYLDPLRSAGELKLFNFSLNKYAPLYQDFVKLELRGGSVAMDTKYRVEFSASNHVAVVENISFALRDLRVGAPGETNDLGALSVLAVNNAGADLSAHTAHVGAVTLMDGKIFLSRNQDAQINVVELGKPNSQAAPPEGILFLLRSVTNAVTLLLSTTNDWRASVGEINVTNCSAQLEDFVNSRPARLNLDNISFTAKNISNVPGTNFETELSLVWNTNGSIKMKTSGGFYPPTADVRLDLAQIDFHSLDPYLEPKLNLFVLDSKLDLHGDVHLRTPKGELPEVKFSGDTALTDFHTVDGVMSEDLLKWSAVKLSGMEANLNPPSVAVKQIEVNDVYARFVIESNRTINLMNALRMTNAPAATNAVAADDDNETNAAPFVAGPAGTNDFPLPKISVGAIVISNATVSFTDHSLPSDVSLAMKEVSGTISDLSSEQLQHADVDIHGKADGVGPFSVTGKINPFSPTLKNDIKISLKGMDLTGVSAYSGKFAGYRIAQGKLNLELDYEITGTDLKSKNVITLDRFRFGEKVDSPDATHLPVKLGVAILKDRNGQIVLDVPVEGNLKDPKLRISKVVWRAVENILVKVATSPFALLGAAFGGASEELGYQDFQPGSAELSKAGMEKLDALAKSLVEKPALGLEISGSVDRDADREGLQRAAIDRQIKQRVWQRMSKEEQARTNVEDIVVFPGKREKWIGKFYAEAVAKKIITPEMVAANTNVAALAALLAQKKEISKGAVLLAQSAANEKKKSATQKLYQTKLVPAPSVNEAILMTTFPVKPEDLESLAAARAKAVQDYLLNNAKLDPFRLFLKTPEAGSVRGEGSKAYIEFR